MTVVVSHFPVLGYNTITNAYCRARITKSNNLPQRQYETALFPFPAQIPHCDRHGAARPVECLSCTVVITTGKPGPWATYRCTGPEGENPSPLLRYRILRGEHGDCTPR